jgi:5-hydroxyisourate hydrolase
MRITTHVLDTVAGRPAAGVPVALEREGDGGWERIGGGTTDADGRIGDLYEGPAPGRLRLTFDTEAHYLASGTRGFYPEVAVVFEVAADEHVHVPLLLSPYGYTTYRGS